MDGLIPMQTATVINHEGTTCLLPKAKTDKGAAYPFAFDAVAPDYVSWAYRVLPSRDPTRLTPEKLETLLKGSQRGQLRAEWEEQVGHRIGVLTVYRDAQNGTTGGLQAQYERGPDIDTPSKTKAPKPEPMPEPEPEKRGPEMDMF